MNITIREFIPADYPGIAAVDSSVWPDYPETADHLRESDENQDKTQKFGRFVAEREGNIVGSGGYSQWPRDTPRFWTWVHVHRDAQGNGVGKAMYEHLLTLMDDMNAAVMRAEAREGDEHSIRFLTNREFVLEMREKESLLDIEAFDPEQWTAEMKRAEDQGIVIKSYADLKAEAKDLDALHRAMYEVHNLVDEDIPDVDEKRYAPFEEWMKRFSRHHFVPECQMYALDGGKLVGLSMLWARPSDDDMNTGMTGVVREYRKRGIATALKVNALMAAKAHGAKKTRTTNEEGNVGMLGINQRLGFQPQPAWLFYARKLRPEPEVASEAS